MNIDFYLSRLPYFSVIWYTKPCLAYTNTRLTKNTNISPFRFSFLLRWWGMIPSQLAHQDCIPHEKGERLKMKFPIYSPLPQWLSAFCAPTMSISHKNFKLSVIPFFLVVNMVIVKLSMNIFFLLRGCLYSGV